MIEYKVDKVFRDLIGTKAWTMVDTSKIEAASAEGCELCITHVNSLGMVVGRQTIEPEEVDDLPRNQAVMLGNKHFTFVDWEEDTDRKHRLHGCKQDTFFDEY